MVEGEPAAAQQRHPSAAWPLALAYAMLIAYASLYPFSGWRDQGVNPLSFLLAPWPRYWTGFDLLANLLGYAPLGLLLALGWLRGGRAAGSAALLAIGCAALLSLLLEFLQIYLPARVSSNLDFALNSAGGALGAGAALLLERRHLLLRWRRLRDDWVGSDARGTLVLLALWPGALLYPTAIPFALGQVAGRLGPALADWLEGTPFLSWLPLQDVRPQPLPPSAGLLCVAASALLPCLLACSAITAPAKRLAAAGLLLTAGIAVTALSAALSWGPASAWVWLTPMVLGGLGVALAATLLLVRWSSRVGAALAALAALLLSLWLSNQAPASPYFAQTMQIWEQGHFIRFHGATQWLGWCWPYLAFVHLLLRLRPARRNLESPP